MLAGRYLLRAFGNEYQAGESVLSSLALAVVAHMILATPHPIVAARREGVALLLATLALATNLALGFVFIPRYGASGAAWAYLTATLVTKLFYVGVYYRLGLPLGSASNFFAGLLVVAWFALAALSSGTLHLVTMVLGLILGGIWAAVLLARARLF